MTRDQNSALGFNDLVLKSGWRILGSWLTPTLRGGPEGVACAGNGYLRGESTRRVPLPLFHAFRARNVDPP
jgi:hypothetical protein